MKLTEIALISEIDHDDSVYSKEASDRMLHFTVDGTWKPLISDVGGHQLVWKQIANEYRVVMLDRETKASMFRLALVVKTVRVPGGTLTGVITHSLSSRKEYRGQGLALKIYEALLDHGQVLFSSSSQTSGSRKLWEELAKRHLKNTFVLAEGAAARWYIRKFADDQVTAANVLLTGPYARLNDEAYASEETRWVIVPGNVDTLRAKAIEL